MMTLERSQSAKVQRCVPGIVSLSVEYQVEYSKEVKVARKEREGGGGVGKGGIWDHKKSSLKNRLIQLLTRTDPANEMISKND